MKIERTIGIIKLLLIWLLLLIIYISFDCSLVLQVPVAESYSLSGLNKKIMIKDFIKKENNELKKVYLSFAWQIGRSAYETTRVVNK